MEKIFINTYSDMYSCECFTCDGSCNCECYASDECNWGESNC